MAFSFSLQTLLRFRQSREQQQELHLRAANQRVAAVRDEIAKIDLRLQLARTAQLRCLQTGATAVELQFERLCEAVLREHHVRMRKELAQREKSRDEERVRFEQARRERETVEALRDRQLLLYQQEIRRREQRQLDDLFLLRRQYLRQR